MELWRISAFASLSGEGGRLYPGRWHSGGQPIVYLAASPPGALIEALVHLELQNDELPPAYTLLTVFAPAALIIADLKHPSPRPDWNDYSTTRKLGDTWLAARRSAIAKAPSSIMPRTWNYLLNPLHPDASRVRIKHTDRAIYDSRLLFHSP